MKNMLRVFNLTRPELFALIIVILILFEFSYGPIIQNFRDAPKDRYYWGGIEYPIDNIGSMSIVREGMLGHWQMQYKFSSTLESKPGIVKFEYLVVGQIAKLLHLEIIPAYFLTRFIISIANILLISFIVVSVFKSTITRISGFLFAISTKTEPLLPPSLVEVGEGTFRPPFCGPSIVFHLPSVRPAGRWVQG